MSGWASVGQGLGALFGGGQERDERVYQEQLLRNATAADKMAAARINQLKAIASDGVYADETIPMLHRNMMLSGTGSDFNAIQSGLKTQQGMSFVDRAQQALQAGDFDLANSFLAANDGKPLKVNDVLGGGRFQGNAYDVGGDMMLTAFGVSNRDAEIARAQASNASAVSSYSTAALNNDKRISPERYRAPPSAGTSVFAKPSDIKTIREMNSEEIRQARREGRQPELIPEPALGEPMSAPATVEPVAPLANAAPAGMPKGAQQAPDGNWYVKVNGVWNLVEL